MVARASTAVTPAAPQSTETTEAKVRRAAARHVPAPALIDGLTANECYDAFCAGQRDRTCFELLLEPARVRVGDQVYRGIGDDVPPATTVLLLDEAFGVVHGIAPDGRLRYSDGTTALASRYLVRRPCTLTAPQREAARAIWANALSYRTVQGDALDAHRAIRVVATSQDDEIEALAADVLP